MLPQTSGILSISKFWAHLHRAKKRHIPEDWDLQSCRREKLWVPQREQNLFAARVTFSFAVRTELLTFRYSFLLLLLAVLLVSSKLYSFISVYYLYVHTASIFYITASYIIIFILSGNTF
jgi:hypothetical protein